MTYSIHPPTISEQIQTHHYHHHSENVMLDQKHKRKSYGWIKIFAIGLNLIYMLKSLEDIYLYESIVTKEQHHYYKTTSATFDLLLSSIILFTLMIDLIMITTKKLSIANSIWRPGVFSFSFLLGQKMIQLMNKVINHDYYFNSCQQNLDDQSVSNHLISIICEQQLEIEQISSFLFLCRDILVCTIYVIGLRYYMPFLIQKLKKEQQKDSIDTNEESH
ncbi:unnamed protein product [Cunninghamella blakesleeana]